MRATLPRTQIEVFVNQMKTCEYIAHKRTKYVNVSLRARNIYIDFNTACFQLFLCGTR